MSRSGSKRWVLWLWVLALVWVSAHAQNEPSATDDMGEIEYVISSDRLDGLQLRVTQDMDGEVRALTVDVFEHSPLAIDKFLDVRDFRSDSIDYNLEFISEEYAITRILGLPTHHRLDQKLARQHATWKLELPYVMDGVNYLQDEWAWPIEHRGIVVLVEYPDRRWGFVELVKQDGSDLVLKARYHEFLEPKPRSAFKLRNRIAKKDGWPAFKLVGEVQIDHDTHRQGYLVRSPEHGFRLSQTIEYAFESEAFTKVYDIFAKTKGDNRVVATFGHMLKLARRDDFKVSGLSEMVFAGAYWPLYYLLSYSSSKNLQTLWTHYSDEIVELVNLDAKSFHPHFYGALFALVQPNAQAMAQVANTFFQTYPRNLVEAEEVNLNFQIWHRRWLIEDPETFYRAMNHMPWGVDPQYLMMVKEVLPTIPQNKLHPRMLEWVADTLETMGGEEHAVEYLREFKKSAPGFWNFSLQLGKDQINPHCAQLIAAAAQG